MPIIVDAFTDAGRAKIQAEGFHVAKQKFIVLKADDRSLYGKQVRSASHTTHLPIY